MSSVRATRDFDEDALYAQAAPRLEQLLAEGVCAIEIKSGYGLALEHERKQLRVARRLGRSEEHTSELQSLMRTSYAVFCLKKKNKYTNTNHDIRTKYNYKNI